MTLMARGHPAPTHSRVTGVGVVPLYIDNWTRNEIIVEELLVAWQHDNPLGQLSPWESTLRHACFFLGTRTIAR